MTLVQRQIIERDQFLNHESINKIIFTMCHCMYYLQNYRSGRTKKEKEKGMLINLDS